jgi:hypothetical protein
MYSRFMPSAEFGMMFCMHNLLQRCIVTGMMHVIVSIAYSDIVCMFSTVHVLKVTNFSIFVLRAESNLAVPRKDCLHNLNFLFNSYSKRGLGSLHFPGKKVETPGL